jgi:hypothetical protein
MKKILLLIALLVSVTITEAQKVNKSFADTAVLGDTVSLEMTKPVELTKGVVIFDYTTTNNTGVLAYIRIEGSNDGANWFPYTSTAADAAPGTAGTKQVYQVDALRHIYYRLSFGATLATDDVSLSGLRVIFKEE